MRHLFNFQPFIVALLLLATTIASSADMRSAAELELAKIKSKTVNLSESPATVSIEAPKPTQNLSAWSWQSALMLQSLTPTGSGAIQNNNQYNFEELGGSAFPSIELTLGYLPERSRWKYSSSIKIGYSQQDINLETTRGYTYEDLKLNSTLTAITMTALFIDFAKWNLGATAELGQINYTQSSESKLARFSENAAFIGYGAEGTYKISPKLEGLGRWIQRNKVERHLLAQSSQNKNIDIQANNLEFGLRYAW